MLFKYLQQLKADEVWV